MIPANPAPWEPDTWRSLLKSAIRDSKTLLAELSLHRGDVDHLPAFPVRVPRPFLARMQIGNPNDPLLLQVLSQNTERDEADGYLADPVGETPLARASGLIQKYRHRALLIASPACAVHCRYCFRREFPYADHTPSNLDAALAVIREDASLTEVILSGGDPLNLPDARFDALLTAVAGISHVQRIRIHTRLPVVLPQRITRALLETMGRAAKPVVLVAHCNHAQELDADTARAFRLLRQADVMLLNQAVLLRGINDSADSLCALSERLFEQGVLPYYLHLLDRVRGAHHFALDDAQATAIMDEVHARLPGYLVPRLVREIAGEPGKTVIR